MDEDLFAPVSGSKKGKSDAMDDDLFDGGDMDITLDSDMIAGNSSGKKTSFAIPSTFDEHELFGEGGSNFIDGLEDSRLEAEPWLRWTAKRKQILLLSSIPMILQPLAAAMFQPALPTIKDDLETSYTLAMYTVTAFNLVAGICPIVYGPLSDRFGRKMLFYISLPMYAILSCISGLSFDIWMLIIVRGLMGGFACASAVAGAGYIADMYSPNERGKPLGAQQLPALLAPLLGPLLGGLLASYLGWRSIAFFLAIVALPIAALLFLAIPETAAKANEQKKNFNNLIRSLNPWLTLSILFRAPSVGLICLGRSFGYAAMLVMVLLLPNVLDEQYGLDDTEIGLWLLPFGIATIVGAIAGGIVGDIGVKMGGKGGRLLAAVAFTLLESFGLIGFGWTIEWSHWAAMPFSIVVGFVASATRPSFLSYAINEVPSKSGAVTGAVMMFSSVLGIIICSFSPWMAATFSYASLFSGLAAVTVLAVAPSAVLMGVNFEPQVKGESGEYVFQQ